VDHERSLEREVEEFEVPPQNNHCREMCSGSEAGSYLKLIDSCITQLKAQGHSRTCNEGEEEEERSLEREVEEFEVPPQERDFFIDNLLVQIHFIIVMIR